MSGQGCTRGLGRGARGNVHPHSPSPQTLPVMLRLWSPALASGLPLLAPGGLGWRPLVTHPSPTSFWKRLSRLMSKVNPEPNVVHIMGCYILGNPNGEKVQEPPSPAPVFWRPQIQ